jgi:manganese/zinc/iron transport system substrate-binding protein
MGTGLTKAASMPGRGRKPWSFKRRGGVLAAWLAGLVVATATLGSVWPVAAQSRPLLVVATTGMLADAARAIGGPNVTVTGLLGPGVDPHDHRVTQSDIATMTRADLVLWHGANLEVQMKPFLAELAKRKPVAAVGDALTRDPTIQDALLRDAMAQDYVDPHVWMDPHLWSRVVAAVKDALIGARPDAREAFEANMKQYLKEIDAVSAYAKRVLASVPAEHRVVVSAHDAFNYFGKAYGYEVIGIQGVSTESEAGVARIRELVDFTASRKVPAIFVESSVSDRNVQAVIEGAKAKGHRLTIGGELFSDALGPAGTYEGTYIGMIDHNATTIAQALGGQTPERGMQGKLAGPRT